MLGGTPSGERRAGIERFLYWPAGLKRTVDFHIASPLRRFGRIYGCECRARAKSSENVKSPIHFPAR